MISRTAKTTWGVALVASLGAAAYWIHSSDPVRLAELDFLRQSAAEAEQLAVANGKLQAALPKEDMDALKAANSELLAIRNQSLLLTREITALEKSIATAKAEETPEIKALAAQNQALAGAQTQLAAAQAQAEAQAQAQAQAQAVKIGANATAQLIGRLRRNPDGTLSADARKAAVDAIKGYQDANNGTPAPTVNDLLPYIPAELLREDSQEQFEVISIGPGGQETRTTGEQIRARRNR
jgi:hypothetical protein